MAFGLLALLAAVPASWGDQFKAMGDPLPGMQYPPPRFPRYLVNPDMANLLKAARVAVRQPVGRCPLGRAKPGDDVYVLLQWGQDMQVWEALKTAWAELGVKAHAIGHWETIGISKEEFDRISAANATHGYEGWKELGTFAASYKAFFPAAIQKEFGEGFTNEMQRKKYLPEYLDKHPEVKHFFAFTGAGAFSDAINEEKHGKKFLGNFVYIKAADLLSDAPNFPPDVWGLVEEKILRPRPFISDVTFQDPEGTNLHWMLTREQAQKWTGFGGGGDGASNHISIYPSSQRSTLDKGAVIVAHANHTGLYPSMTVRLDSHGLVQSVEDGARTGDLFRMLVNDPRFKNARFPSSPEPGYWFLMQDGFATNPKFVRSMGDMMDGAQQMSNLMERNRAGVQHFAFTYGPIGGGDKEDEAYAKAHGLPYGGLEHNAHMHNYFGTVKWRLSDTGEWITISEKGYIKAFDDPEVRALASRYGDPDLIFRYEWIPSIPGVNVPGDYKKDFAGDPWGYLMREWKSIQNGSYKYFVDRIAR